MKIKWGMLVACGCLTACSMPVTTVTPKVDFPAQTSTATDDLSNQIPTELPKSEEAEGMIYEVISPETISTEDGFVIDFTGATIEIHPVVGTRFRLGFRYRTPEA